ncbi:PDZ domain-containing protein [Phormidium sp. CLA17]|uniref:carboxyl-terminal processing protease CtpA n=1 Tax=Leptolyngbya sp. Cla-17 TaxID=2803751 RepID=UPI001492ECCA|nr:carboxyl-terminal processing protease CtpA [Leptolyngbya sp. Cla-17]MBM0740601.1 PDZ domain-containing protein [Leptolyngbya sp. Cla-17]
MKQRTFLVRQLFLLLLIVVVTVGFASPAIALTEEQRLVAEAWRLVDRAYVDDTFNHQNWWLVRQKALKQALPDHDSAYSAIQKMLAGLDDPFTRLLKPDQYRSLQTNTSGELTGVGLQISLDSETKVLKVIAPIAGSPADRAGVQPADAILNIDGVPTAGLSLDEAAERMRGPTSSRVVLTVQRMGSDLLNIEIVRDRIALNPVSFELRTADNQSAESPKIKIGYVRLAQFNANATTEVSRAITLLEKQGAEAYVLDLRSNPGGLLLSGIEIARLWMDEGTIVYTVNRQGIEGSFEATGQALTKDPLVVLVNQGTASASEILAGALKDNERATIIGERTFGKGLIQSLFDLSDGAGLAVTVAKYQTPDHIDINKQGIKPDLIVPLDPLAITQTGTQSDRQYEAAVEFLTTPSMVAGAA